MENKERSDAWCMIEQLGKQNKRIFIALMTVIALWFATIGGFVWYLLQYDFENYSYSQDGQGVNVMGNLNEVTEYGAETDRKS